MGNACLDGDTLKINIGDLVTPEFLDKAEDAAKFCRNKMGAFRMRDERDELGRALVALSTALDGAATRMDEHTAVGPERVLQGKVDEHFRLVHARLDGEACA